LPKKPFSKLLTLGHQIFPDTKNNELFLKRSNF
jgi:hypothetical protein